MDESEVKTMTADELKEHLGTFIRSIQGLFGVIARSVPEEHAQHAATCLDAAQMHLLDARAWTRRAMGEDL